MVSYWVIVVGLAYLLFYALVGSKNVNQDIMERIVKTNVVMAKKLMMKKMVVT